MGVRYMDMVMAHGHCIREKDTMPKDRGASWPEEEHGQGVRRGRLERARATAGCAPGVVKRESRAVRSET